MDTIKHTAELLTNGRPVAQGDLRLERWDGEIPAGLDRLKPENDLLILAHSETGHHHAVAYSEDIEVYEQDEFVAYVRNNTDNVIELKHHRSFDTHAPHGIPPKTTLRLIRGREEGPDGLFRKAID